MATESYVHSAMVQPDYEQLDKRSSDFIKNKIVGYVADEYTDTLTWDGNTDGLISIENENLGVYYRVSDIGITSEDLNKYGLSVVNSLASGTYAAGEISTSEEVVVEGQVIFVPYDNCHSTNLDQIIPNRGIYFANNSINGVTTSITLPSYEVFRYNRTNI